MSTEGQLFISKQGLQDLIDALRSDGYQVIAPTVGQEAIVYSAIESADQLPHGQRDQQAPATYRLENSDESSYFGFNLGPHSWKQFLFPPQTTVSTATRIARSAAAGDSDSGDPRPETEGATADTWQFHSNGDPQPKYAFLAVRACELAAMAVQDRVFLEGPYVDPVYRQRRENALIIAVNCTVAASTCFCTSMNTGPRCESGFDLAMTEIDDGFVIEVGSPRGEEILAKVDRAAASPQQLESAEALRGRAVQQIKRQMETENLRDVLMDNLNHPHWDEVAQRCLSCTNCTMVCPTCFCSTVTDESDLTGDRVDRVRRWDSCFNLDFSYTADGMVRGDVRGRFRQWLTHKLATWHDQFDHSGCVGCGRCITWCPVGIDLTEEVAAIRSKPSDRRSLPVAQPKVGSVCVVKEATP